MTAMTAGAALSHGPHKPHSLTSPYSPFAPAALHESELRRHVAQCRAGRGRWFSAAAWMERLHLALAPRFATTVVAAACLVWLIALWP